MIDFSTFDEAGVDGSMDASSNFGNAISPSKDAQMKSR